MVVIMVVIIVQVQPEEAMVTSYGFSTIARCMVAYSLVVVAKEASSFLADMHVISYFSLKKES